MKTAIDYDKIAAELNSILISPSLRLTNEALLQIDLDSLLRKSKHNGFLREYRINQSDRFDFFHLQLGIVIEVKIKGNANEILKQLERYAKNEEVKAIILATAYFMGLPPEINGKPVYMIHLSKGLL